MFTKDDVLEAIGRHRVRQVSIETELVISGKAEKNPVGLGLPFAKREMLEKMLVDMEEEGLIQSYGNELKTYECGNKK